MRTLLLGLSLVALNPGAQAVTVDIAVVRKQTQDLAEAVASPKTTDPAVHAQAAAFFANIQWETPQAGTRYFMDREHVDGDVATAADAAALVKERYDHYKFALRGVPPAYLESAVAFAGDMAAQKRVRFDPTGKMPDNQMGTFLYFKNKLEGGLIEMNGRLALIATRIGKALITPTLLHETQHAKDHAAGQLSTKRTKTNERDAYRTEWAWIKALDPRAERMIVLHSTLNLYLKSHPGDLLTIQSIAYLEHLLEVYDTNGEDAKIDALVLRRGYEDGNDDHEGGVRPDASGIRA